VNLRAAVLVTAALLVGGAAALVAAPGPASAPARDGRRSAGSAPAAPGPRPDPLPHSHSHPDPDPDPDPKPHPDPTPLPLPELQPRAEPPPAPEPRPSAKPGAAPARALTLLDRYVLLRHSRPTPDEIRLYEQELADELARLEPRAVVDLLPAAAERGALILDVVLRQVDRALGEDRETWEEALVLAVEGAGDERRRLALLGEVALPRVEEPERREQLEGYLRKRAPHLLSEAGRR